jgi:hypothetical protein
VPATRAKKYVSEVAFDEHAPEPDRSAAATGRLGRQPRLRSWPSNLLADRGAFHGETSVLAQEIALEVARMLRAASVSRETDPKRLGDVQPALLNMEQAAKYLGRTVKGIRELILKGILVPVRLDRKIQFKRQDLDDVIERCTE